MSVPEGKRGEGKFEVLLKARDLATYTIQICTNENIFLPRYQNAITNDIISEAKDIFIKCFTANNIRVSPDGSGASERIRLQKEACNHCNNLLAMMQIAQQIFHLKTKRVEYWGRRTIEVRNMIRAWMDSDKSRYK